jgi:hypothetical protein
MNVRICLLFLLVCSLCLGVPDRCLAQSSMSIAEQKALYHEAKAEIEAMLEERAPLSYERAIYLLENAWYDNRIDYRLFQQVLEAGTHNINSIISSSNAQVQTENGSSFFDALSNMSKAGKGYEEKAKVNFAIYKYLTDTTLFLRADGLHRHLPYQYASIDPMGSNDWRFTQVNHLIKNRVGNCFAFASLFKIYADRLSSDADLCTAPGHIYITHKDYNGTQYNIEVASRAFPGVGTLVTLTHSTRKAIENNVALRQLTLKQSVALTLVYLAKGYEHKFHCSDFGVDCANTVLKFDSLNLNAILLKAESMEDQILATGKSLTQLQEDEQLDVYQEVIAKLYNLGYREMPLSMKNLLVKGLIRDTVSRLASKNYTSTLIRNKDLPSTRRASLSWGLFEEQIVDQKIERYGRTLYDTREQRIVGFATEQQLYNQYNFDPVVFAWNIDPLAHKFPSQSPYSAFADNPIYYIDVGGAFQYPADKAASYKKDYPMLTKYFAEHVQNDIMRSSTIMSGMAKYSEGNLTPAQIKSDTKWGNKSSPTIHFDPSLKSNEDGTGFYARYDNRTNTIHINKDFADKTEKILGSNASAEDKQAAMYSMFAIITHEEVHRGDYLDGHRQTELDPSGWGGEPGAAFMADVFESKDVKIEGGEVIRVNTLQSIHGQAKELIKMQRSEGKSDVIPTVPSR